MKKLLALLPFLALMIFVTSCSDDDEGKDNPIKPTPAVKVLELESSATIESSLLLVTNGESEKVVTPKIKNTGNVDVKLNMEIKIDSNEGDLVVAACLGNGEGEAQCLPGFKALGTHSYDPKEIVVQPNTITEESHIAIHFQPFDKVGTVSGEFIFTNKSNDEDVITIPFTFTSKKLGGI